MLSAVLSRHMLMTILSSCLRQVNYIAMAPTLENRWLTALPVSSWITGPDCVLWCCSLLVTSLPVAAAIAAAFPPVPACAMVAVLYHTELLCWALSPSLRILDSVLWIGIGSSSEWQAPALIKPAEALVPLVSSFHNYPRNSFII